MQSPETSNQPHLHRTPSREAIAPLNGYDFQVWMSIDHWFDLPEGAVLFLEGAEDIDKVEGETATTTQVRLTKKPISLNTAYARDAIKNFWRTQEKDAHSREVRYIYLTTSSVAMENNAAFYGRTGLETWEHARYDVSSAELLRTYLDDNLGAEGTLQSLLRTAPIEQVQLRLFSRLSWITGQPSADTVREIIIDKLEAKLRILNLPRPALSKIRAQLLDYCWQQIRKPDLAQRVLTAKTLSEQLESATQIHFTMPLGAVGGVVAAMSQLGLQGTINSAALLTEELPLPPEPILTREQLVGSIVTHLKLRKPVLLTGTVFQGKTTLAILAANKLCPSAWWVDLTDRQPANIREIFNLFSFLIATNESPNMLVFDDLNTSVSAITTYGNSLKKLLHRARSLEKSVLLTARGTPQILDSDLTIGWGTQVINVESMDEAEIAAHSLELGCPRESEAQYWGKIIFIQTSGHPRLVHVRIKELSELGWPEPTASQLISNSTAVQTAQQLARTLLAETVFGAESEFVYLAAEFSTLPTKEMLLGLGDHIEGLTMASNLIAKLEGKWLESVSKTRYRVSPILKAVLGETWSKAKFQAAHLKIFDAIQGCEFIDQIDAASLMFHAYICREPQRVGETAAGLINISDEKSRNSIYRQLSWMIPLSQKNEESIFEENPEAALMLRQLQFQVAVAHDDDAVNTIMKGWKVEVDKASPEKRDGFEQMRNVTVMLTPVHLSPDIVLDCAVSAFNVKGEIGEIMIAEITNMLRTSFEAEIPKEATTFQIMVAVKSNLTSDAPSLNALASWIAQCENQALLLQLDQTATWPLVAAGGAFVHQIWHNESTKASPQWEQVKQSFMNAWSVLRWRGMRHLGIQLAKAVSIIESEYEKDVEAALAVISQASADFGASAVLEEQRANCYFQAERLDQALDTWDALTEKFGNVISDPYAYRRIGVAAAKRDRWADAAKIFRDGANCLPTKSPMSVKCALLAEAALAYWKAGDSKAASSCMVECWAELPPQAGQREDPQWEAVMRALTGTAMQIRGESAMTPEGEPFTLNTGFISNPKLSMKKTDDLQDFRTQILELEVFTGVLLQTPGDSSARKRIENLAESKNLQVAWMVVLNILQVQLKTGISSNFVQFVEWNFKITEEIRKVSPYSHLNRLAEREILPYYLLAIICTGNNIVSLELVLGDALAKKDFEVSAKNFSGLKKGLEMPVMVAERAVLDENMESAIRCGAALSILENPNRNVRMTAASQAALVMQLVHALSAFKGKGIDQLVAKKFAADWLPLMHLPHLFATPVVTLPALQAAIDDIDNGRAGLKKLLTCASAASAVQFANIISALP